MILKNKKLINILRYLIALIPIIFIFSRIKWDLMQDAVFNTSWWVIPTITFIIILCMFLQGIRWWITIKPFNSDVSLLKVLKAHFIGIYLSIIVPSSGAQNIIRAAVLSKHLNYSLSWGSSYITGIFGLLAFAFLSFFGLAFIDKSTLPKGFLESILSAFCIIIILFLLSFSKKVTSKFKLFVKNILPQKIYLMLENIRESIYQYSFKPKLLILIFFFTLLINLLLTLNACIVILGITGKFFLYECLLYIPIIEILCISIPLTPNGIGVREAFLAIMFNKIGLTPEQLGIYVILGFYAILLKIIGGIPLIFSGTQKKPIKNNNE